MLDRIKIIDQLETKIFGQNLFCLEKIDSTNRYAMNLARQGAPEGSVVCANFQTEGHGRQSRSWYSKPGQNLLMSLILRPKQQIEFAQRITLAAAIILKKSIQTYLQSVNCKNIDLELKWPNDLLINGKKAAGILAESVLRDKNIEALVLGFGINLNMIESDLPKELKQIATSVAMACGKEVEIEKYFLTFIREFESAYIKMECNNYACVVDEWKKHCRQFGEKIRVHTVDGAELASFSDVDKDGYLIYTDEKGFDKKLVAGDVERIN